MYSTHTWDMLFSASIKKHRAVYFLELLSHDWQNEPLLSNGMRLLKSNSKAIKARVFVSSFSQNLNCYVVFK